MSALELPILRVLESAHPRQLRRAVLQAEVQLASDDFTVTEFNRALVLLEQKDPCQIRIYPGEDVQRVVITDDGLERLAKTR